MHTIRYARGKLLLRAFLAALVLLSAWYIMSDPQPATRVTSWKAVFWTGFGRTLLVPPIFLGGIWFTWRMLRLALGSRAALQLGDEGITVVNWWGTRKIPWRDFRRAELRSVWLGWFWTSHQLVIHRYRGRAVRVSIGAMEINPERRAMVFELIEVLQRKAFAMGTEMSPAFLADLYADDPASAPPPARPESEADAALARYMAKRARGLLEAPGPAPTAAPRAAFGRKRV